VLVVQLASGGAATVSHPVAGSHFAGAGAVPVHTLDELV
jgi:hypothetical protein